MALKTILPKADILPQEWLRNSGTDDFFTYIDEDPDGVEAPGSWLETPAPFVGATAEANFSFRDAFQEASFGGATAIEIKARVQYLDAGGGDPTSAAIKFSYLINGVVQGTVEFDTPITQAETVRTHTFSGLSLTQSQINSLDIRFEDGTIVDPPIGGIELNVLSVRVFVTHAVVSPTEKTITPLTPTEKTITATACTGKTISRAQFLDDVTSTVVPIADGAELDFIVTPGGADHFSVIDEGTSTPNDFDLMTSLVNGAQDRWQITSSPTEATLLSQVDFVFRREGVLFAAVLSYKLEYMINDSVEATFTSENFTSTFTVENKTHSVSGLSITPSDGDTHEIRVTLTVSGVAGVLAIYAVDLVYHYTALRDTPRTEKTITTTACTEKTITALTPTEKVI